MNKIKRYFAVARQTAKLEKYGYRRKYRLGAVGIRADGVIVSAQNLVTPAPNQKCHAEYRLCDKLTPKSVVFVVRIDRLGHFSTAKPCINCEGKMRNIGVSRVYYSISDNEYGVLNLK
jgi:tRNA(Arg) A34 adenosine deaminase TadA